jgi:hypothetical protein
MKRDTIGLLLWIIACVFVAAILFGSAFLNCLRHGACV